MDYLREKEIASVKLIDVEVSEDELDVYQRCLSYPLQHLKPKEIAAAFGATKEELAGMLASMEDVMARAGILGEEEEEMVEAEK